MQEAFISYGLCTKGLQYANGLYIKVGINSNYMLVVSILEAFVCDWSLYANSLHIQMVSYMQVVSEYRWSLYTSDCCMQVFTRAPVFSLWKFVPGKQHHFSIPSIKVVGLTMLAVCFLSKRGLSTALYLSDCCESMQSTYHQNQVKQIMYMNAQSSPVVVICVKYGL